ncbi:MAG: SAM-dependent methyltransferase, partial [Natronospirillum sp.]
MSGNSRTIATNQSGVHEALLVKVAAHQEHRFQKPIAPFNASAFADATQWLEAHQGPWILDSGCGVGESTRWLAEQFPGHLVLGV